MTRKTPTAASAAVVGAELMAASAQVIAARTTMMANGMTSIGGPNLTEMSLMSTEKTEAISASAAAMAASAGAMGHRLGRAAMAEGAIALRAAAAVAEARTPVQAAHAQFSYALGWWGRAATQAMRLNADLMTAQADAMAPIHKTATANARRLNKR